MPYFLDFLSGHDQSHLLLFWLEVEVFELAAGGGPSLVTQATRIYESYLGPDAPHRIELPPTMLTFLQAEVQTSAPNINVFSAAHAFVFRRLRQTWYPAFLLSSTYQSLLEHLKYSYRTPLKEILIDEIQSRYIEAFLLNTDAKLGPVTVGNVYLWKKIHHDLRPLGIRLARDRLSGPAGDAKNIEDLRLFIADAKAAYEAYIQPSPQTGIPGGPPLSTRVLPSGGKGKREGGRERGSTPSATALGPELRHRLAECLGRLVSQSRYYSGIGTGGIGQIDRSIIGELTSHLIDAQRVILSWLEVEVYPSFRKSWLCGILAGDIQSRRSAPVRRKKRLRTLFKSIRSFRHVYVPPCPRSEGRGLVLVSTEGVSKASVPLTHELVWGFDVAVFPIVPALRASDLRTDVEGGEEEEVVREKVRGLRLDDEEEGDWWGAVGGAILSTKNRDGDAGIFQLGESPKDAGKEQGQPLEQKRKTKRMLQFRSAIRSSQVMGLKKPMHSKRKREQKAEFAADEMGEERATNLCAAIEGELAKEIQRLAFPSLCLMPLERSTFVLFSPKLVVPEATLHHFVLPIVRKDIETKAHVGEGAQDANKNSSSSSSSSPFLKSPRAAIRSPSGDGEVEPPDLTADDVFHLYGACLIEWAPAGDEVLLPRCLALVSTEPRVASLRRAVLALRKTLGGPGVGGSPITPDTPKKTPWQLEDEQQQQRQSKQHHTPALLDVDMFARRKGEEEVMEEEEVEGEEDPAAYWSRACSKEGGASTSMALFSPKAASASNTFGATGGFLSPTAGGGLLMTDAASTISIPTSCSLPPPLVHSLPQHVDASFLPLFQALSPETFLKAFTATLLERPIIMKSSSRSLTMLASEGLRRLIYPFAWLQPYQPLLPVGGICNFWDYIRKKAGGTTWFDYAFEENGLDDSLVGGRGERASYAEPMTMSSSGRQVPGFLVGLETCIVEAALTATKVVSPAYGDENGGGSSSGTCHAWACANCDVHDGGHFAGDGGFDMDSPFSPGRSSPLSTRSTPRTTRECSSSKFRGSSGLGGSAAGGGGAGKNSSTTKYGELPSCVRASARELLAHSYIVDLDKDSMIEPRRGNYSTTALPSLPEAAASALLTSLQRIFNPSVAPPTAVGGEVGLYQGYGYRTVCAARAAGAAAVAAAATAAKDGVGRNRKLTRDGRHGGGARSSLGASPDSQKRELGNVGGNEGDGNEQLHGAFVMFFRQVLLDRYREYTISYLEEQMVAFHADSFFASQPEPSHGFWTDLFQTRLFAHFLVVEHQRVAASFEEPALQRPPGADQSEETTTTTTTVECVDV